MNAVSEIQPTAATTPATPACSSTPGALLRHEREQRGLTVQQVSEELHLDAWLVEALEQNRFLALGAPVYAKGHLRKYAVLLGLSPDLILARYQVIAEPPPPVQLPPRAALLTPDPLPRSFDWRRLVPKIEWQGIDWRMYGLIAGVLLTASTVWLVAYYLRASSSEAPQVAQTQPAQVPQPHAPQQQSESQPAPTLPPAVEASVPPSKGAVLPQPAAVAMSPPPAAAPARPAKTPAASSPVSGPMTAAVRPPEARATASKPAKVETQKPVAATPKVAATPVKPVTVAPQRVAAVTPVKPPAAAQTKLAAPAPAPAPLPEIPQVSLRLEFAVASWAEVYDGDGRRLLYAVGDPNRPRTVSGKPPLKVTLGMAGSVQARVNGRPIAIPRRIGQDSASFTVGPNGSIR